HPEVTAERRRPPVDTPDPVAGLPLAEIGELDAFATGPRDLVPREHLRLERRHERLERLLARIDAQLLRLSRLAFPGAEAGQVPRTDEQRPHPERSPALAAYFQLEGPRLVRPKVERPRGSSCRAQLPRQREEQLEPVDDARRGDLDRCRDLVAL